MDKNIFLKLLEDANLSKKDFAELSKVSYGTVSNWSENRPVPDWVESWLRNYIKAEDIDKVIETMKSYIKEKEQK